jgi:hypothetical protein
MADVQISTFPLSLPVDDDIIHIKKVSGEDNKATFESFADEILDRVPPDPFFDTFPTRLGLQPGDLFKIQGESTETEYKTSMNAMYLYFASKMMPVGTIYYNRTNATNPSTLFGFGTWVQKRGVFLVGEGSSTDANGVTVSFTANTSGGEHSHAITEAEMASHRHSMFKEDTQTSDFPISTATDVVASIYGAGNNNSYKMVSISGTPAVGGTSLTGSGTRHNNIPHYNVVYIWERTA